VNKLVFSLYEELVEEHESEHLKPASFSREVLHLEVFLEPCKEHLHRKGFLGLARFEDMVHERLVGVDRDDEELHDIHDLSNI
jgi:hypothetical protein